ncbi:gamma-glutamylcyclotransferase-like [Acanthaster planci]|uniref:gamma-glutamylcyclotransferase n=1 Tax=Acanthaster planci TaxID=133434 RepID=A0A8B7YPG6_ACAPL|nr:gamma-glutamylcyclotransferase-like [Acanthaster planci]
MSFLYFAYGSNLLRERIHISNPSAVFVAAAKLNNYRLGFCIKPEWKENLTRWRGGAGTIVKSEGDSVWGVVWKLDSTDLESLDKQEGVHEGVYRRLEHLQVTAATSQSILECISYQFKDPFFVKPSPYYLKVIKMGALQNNLPEEYRRYLDSIEDNGYSGPLPVFDEIMRNVKL